jgi:hypothetical protein
MLAGDAADRRWNAQAWHVREGSPSEGEGLVVHGNGLGYYAWLRSLLIGGDLDFDDEFDCHPLPDSYVPPASYTTPIGRRANQWSVGPACVWAPLVTCTHFGLRAVDPAASHWDQDGYSIPYQLAVGLSSLSLTLFGVSRVWRTCAHVASPAPAAWAVFVTVLGTPVVYYGAVELSMAHGPGTAVLAALVWYWLTSYGGRQLGRWACVGGLVGAAALMRWQLVTFAVLPLGEAFLLYVRGIRDRKGPRSIDVALQLGSAGLAAVLAFCPQLVAWRLVYGSWFVQPIVGVQHHWLTPSWWEVLFSEDRGLFYWTPVTAVMAAAALAGCFLPEASCLGDGTVVGRDKRDCLRLLCLGWGIQVYALACIWGKGPYLPDLQHNAGVFLASSYGFRDLTESLVVLAPGLACVLDDSRGRRYGLLASGSCLLVVWNLFLVCQYYHGLLLPNAGATLGALAANVWRLVREDWLVLFIVLPAPILTALLLSRAGGWAMAAAE